MLRKAQGQFPSSCFPKQTTSDKYGRSVQGPARPKARVAVLPELARACHASRVCATRAWQAVLRTTCQSLQPPAPTSTTHAHLLRLFRSCSTMTMTHWRVAQLLSLTALRHRSTARQASNRWEWLARWSGTRLQHHQQEGLPAQRPSLVLSSGMEPFGLPLTAAAASSLTRNWLHGMMMPLLQCIWRVTRCSIAYCSRAQWLMVQMAKGIPPVPLPTVWQLCVRVPWHVLKLLACQAPRRAVCTHQLWQEAPPCQNEAPHRVQAPHCRPQSEASR